ncbi:MAG: ParB/RepB/Spo0J family partition protein [Coriobacteriales bacterium]|nr:ParB/RepB/Spo0J family partition protein [Coriobacteriales bacterium]
MVKKAGLGRGLGALLGDAGVGVAMGADGAPALRELSIDEVRPNPNQPRRNFDEDELNELADSIAQNGILQPIVARPLRDGYEIVAGERRWQAARRAGLTQVPVVVREVSDNELLQLALIENLQRSDLNAIEAARGYAQLMQEQGLTQAELGKILSKSRPAIANALRLLELPQDVQEMVVDGSLSAGHARAILSAQGDEARSALAAKVVSENLTVRMTETLAPLFSVNQAEETSNADEDEQASSEDLDGSHNEAREEGRRMVYTRAAERLRDGLDTKVRVHTVRGRNKIEIEFTNEDELASLVDKIVGMDQ